MARSRPLGPRALPLALLLALVLGSRLGADEGAADLFGMGGAPPAAPAGGPVAAAPVEAIPDRPTLIALLRRMLRPQLRIQAPDRHQLRAALQPPVPTAKGATLVLAFEGTRGFDARISALLARAHRPLRGRLRYELADSIRSAAVEAFEAEGGHTTAWSGLAAGPLAALFQDPGLLAGNLDWFSFPSEEVEALADLEALGARDLPEQISRARRGAPRVLADAVRHTEAYLRAAVAMGAAPRLVVLGHSSGGRTAVKVLQELRKERDPRTGGLGIRVDLVMTIDPVREAHEVLGEILPKLLGSGLLEGARVISPLGRLLAAPRIPVVEHRSQPESLYKPDNVGRFVSVFQRRDTLGLKVGPRFGIHGSPVAGADEDQEVFGLGDDAHGAICYAAATLAMWRRELRRLAPPR